MVTTQRKTTRGGVAGTTRPNYNLLINLLRASALLIVLAELIFVTTCLIGGAR